MIQQSYYLSDENNLSIIEDVTGLALDELESIVDRFASHSHRKGQLRDELVVFIDGTWAIRHHFPKKILIGVKEKGV